MRGLIFYLRYHRHIQRRLNSIARHPVQPKPAPEFTTEYRNPAGFDTNGFLLK